MARLQLTDRATIAIADETYIITVISIEVDQPEDSDTPSIYVGEDSTGMTYVFDDNMILWRHETAEEEMPTPIPIQRLAADTVMTEQPPQPNPEQEELREEQRRMHELMIERLRQQETEMLWGRRPRRTELGDRIIRDVTGYVAGVDTAIPSAPQPEPAPAPRPTREPRRLVNIADIRARLNHYRPRIGDRDELAFFNVSRRGVDENFHIEPHLNDRGDNYTWYDDDGEEWINQHSDGGRAIHELPMNDRYIDSAGQYWTRATTLRIPKKGSKRKKTLRRKQPMPEIKDPTYYASSEYIG